LALSNLQTIARVFVKGTRGYSFVFLQNGNSGDAAMNKHEEYRLYAEQALEFSERAKNPADKASWLRIARRWLDLLPKRELTALEEFDANARRRGTGQEDSSSSH
jgi:hypothetical protein